MCVGDKYCEKCRKLPTDSHTHEDGKCPHGETMARSYGSPFDRKAEGKKIKIEAKAISNPSDRETFLNRENDALTKYAKMLEKTSAFVNQKSSNGAYKNPG